MRMLLAILWGAVLVCGDFAAARERPNFVFLLVDDLGWADVGCNGSTFYETPNIDRLAASGMRFTQGYAACPVCSPTRASIMTGRHPVRVDITDWIPGMHADRVPNARFQQIEDRHELALSEVTIAEVLKDAGYRTFFAGKWHLGDAGHLPTDQGFETNIGGYSAGSPPGGYYGPWKNPYLKQNFEGEYLTERLTAESVKFLQTRPAEQPFLLYLAYYNVHTPIQPYKPLLPHFATKAREMFGETPAPPILERQGVSRSRQDHPEYASMIGAVDVSVGTILKALEELKLTDNTVVIFFSDNGGLCTLKNPGPTSNLPLRSGKGWLYEGGIREPLLIRAPGVTTPGSVCEQPVISTDFFPTILELAGLPLQPDLHIDGVSLLPLLKRAQQPVHPPLYWHYPHYHGSTWTPGAAVRDGDWKLIEFYEEDRAELYNLKEDVGEQHDLSQQQPEQFARLRQQLRTWQQALNARMPVPR